jgi:uncharacterized membrane protein
MMLRSLVVALAAIGSASAFSSLPDAARPQKTALQMKNDGKKVAASFLTAAFIATNVFAVDAAFATDDFDFGGSTEIVAGRSGGRGGGRASRAPSRSSYSAPAPTRTIERTTIIQQPSYTPSIVVSPFGYNPYGGFGMGYGFGALNSIGNEIRDNRQESEIQRSRAELEQARMKEAELEGRLRSLEAAQAK